MVKYKKFNGIAYKLHRTFQYKKHVDKERKRLKFGFYTRIEKIKIGTKNYYSIYIRDKKYPY